MTEMTFNGATISWTEAERWGSGTSAEIWTWLVDPDVTSAIFSPCPIIM